MAVVILDVCPRCRKDVSRRLGVITTRTIVCPRCDYEMKITANAVTNNGQYNGVMRVALPVWIGLAAAILASPTVAAAVGGLFKLPVQTLQNRLIVALVAGILAVVVGLPFAVLGRMIGF